MSEKNVLRYPERKEKFSLNVGRKGSISAEYENFFVIEFLNNNDVDVARPDRISGADINAIIQEVKFILKLPKKVVRSSQNDCLHKILVGNAVEFPQTNITSYFDYCLT